VQHFKAMMIKAKAELDLSYGFADFISSLKGTIILY